MLVLIPADSNFSAYFGIFALLLNSIANCGSRDTCDTCDT